MLIYDVAALYVDPKGVYPKLVEHWWDEKRDARNYAGPWPIVAHPPCGPWGRLRHMYRGSEHALGPLAVEQVRKYGGVLEHPYGSHLWLAVFPQLPPPERGARDDWGGFTVEVEQVYWGHVARKKTWLYCVGAPRYATDIVPPFPNRKPTHHVSRDAKRARRNGYTLKRTSSKQNRETPIHFAEWLISLAQRAGVIYCPQVGCHIAGPHEHQIQGPADSTRRTA